MCIKSIGKPAMCGFPAKMKHTPEPFHFGGESDDGS